MVKYSLLLFLLTQSVNMIAQHQTIKTHQWQHRLLLIFAPSVTDPTWKAQLALLDTDSIGLKERDILVYEIFEKTGTSFDGKSLPIKIVEEIRAAYRVEEEDFVVVLIGKDGGEKWRSLELVSLEKLYNIIDVMPMRMQEIQQQKKKGRHQK